MSDESGELTGNWKVALGTINLALSGGLTIKFDAFRPPAGFETLCLLLAPVAMLVGMAIAFSQRVFRIAASVMALVMAIGAAFWYSTLVARSGLVTWEQVACVSCYIGVAGLVAYLLAASERTIAGRPGPGPKTPGPIKG